MNRLPCTAIRSIDSEETVLKRFISLILVCVLSMTVFSGCDRKPASAPAVEETAQTGSFAPETTAVASSGLVQAIDSVQEAEPADVSDTPVVDEQPVAQDAAATDEIAVDEAIAEPSLEPAPAVTEEPENDTVIMPFATATPQPNVTVSSYTEIAVEELGFKFSHPSNWNNIPGRSTVCYVQPLDNGTVYPARVAVTMKKLAHKCSASEATKELAEYVKMLRSQYDEATFKVNKTLDEGTKFMGNKAMSTTYLAYDGEQEIQGYVIMTYFERYLFCFHFLCAYEDYEAFQPAMVRMRDSVQPNGNLNED